MAQELIKQEEEITTADLVHRREPEDAGERRVDGSPRTAAENHEALFPASESETFRSSWHDIQAGFVDEPRPSVEKADKLVASVIHRLAEIYAEERAKLEADWSKGGEVSTEDLRQALRKYRSFLVRLLAM